MSAPVNNNWANATGIAAMYNSGACNIAVPFVGTNVGATAEIGEPPNNGSTVWFAWLCVRSMNYKFSTRVADAKVLGTNTSVVNPFQTVAQVFTGSAVNALTEISYLVDFHRGWDSSNEAFVIFAATAGTTYYFRVDSRGLATGQFSVTLTYNCTQKCSCPSTGLPQLSFIEVMNAKVFCTWQFDGGRYFPPGDYTFVWCCGAVNYAGKNPPTGLNCWGVDPSEPLGRTIHATYFKAAGVPSDPTTDGEFPTGGHPTLPDATHGSSQAVAEAYAATLGLSVTVTHFGGPLGINFTTVGGAASNLDGAPNSSFGLYSSVPQAGCCSDCSFLTISSTVCMTAGASKIRFVITNPKAQPASGYLAMSAPVGFAAVASSVGFVVPPNATVNVDYPISLTASAPGSVTGTVGIFNQFDSSACGTLNFTCSIASITANGGFLGLSGNVASGRLNLTVTGCATPFLATVTLQNTGGVSNAPGPFTKVLSPGNNQIGTNGSGSALTFNIAPISNTLIATLVVADQYGTVLATIPYNLKPGLFITQSSAGGGGCAGSHKNNLQATNTGSILPSQNLKVIGNACVGGVITLQQTNFGNISQLAVSVNRTVDSITGNTFFVSDDFFSYPNLSFT